jgi:hypothetical protein
MTAGEISPPSKFPTCPRSAPASPLRPASGGGIARDPRHAVEVAVEAGKVRQAVGLHHSYQEGIARKKLMRATQLRSLDDVVFKDRQDLDADLCD